MEIQFNLIHWIKIGQKSVNVFDDDPIILIINRWVDQKLGLLVFFKDNRSFFSYRLGVWDSKLTCHIVLPFIIFTDLHGVTIADLYFMVYTVRVSNVKVLLKITLEKTPYFTVVGQKIEKSPGQKNLWNQINQFHENFFLAKFHFLRFQKWPKINFN